LPPGTTTRSPSGWAASWARGRWSASPSTSGRGLLRYVPLTVITRIAAAIMAVLAVLSLIKAIRG
jgi:hypothetical protein